MSLLPGSIEIGACYLTKTGMVRRVLHIFSDGRVQYESRPGATLRAFNSMPHIRDLRSFAFSVERAVPCDWTPERQA